MDSKDLILSRFFEIERWRDAIENGMGKEMSQDLLRAMCEPKNRAALYRAIRDGRYRIEPPHTAFIPKDVPGEFRTVYVNDEADRVILSIANTLFFELTPDLIHHSCRSYRKGVGCGSVVREVARHAAQLTGETIGWKSDLSKYFDSVAIEHIDMAFDILEERFGQSALVDMIRDYYHSDEYLDEKGTVCHKYMSLRQGCAVSAWLSDVILYHIDEELSRLDGLYIRYCDDMLFLGPDHDKAMSLLQSRLSEMGLSLNPRKVESIGPERWFTFLGYSIRGHRLSLSPGRLVYFQRLVDTTARETESATRMTQCLCRRLFSGHDWKCWATQVLPVINSIEDIQTLNAYIMDAIRGKMTGKGRIGGLGYNRNGKDGCIVRGKGRNVASNRAKTPGRLPGYLSLMCLRNALRHSRGLYIALAKSISTA